MKFLKVWIFCVCICVMIHFVFPQRPYDVGIPWIQNYQLEELSFDEKNRMKALPQNWGMVQDKRGVIYIGNTFGIIEFDGTHFRIIKNLINKQVCQLELDGKGQVYVGAAGDFGYLGIDKFGEITFVSLKEYLPGEYRNFQIPVQDVEYTTHGIYFITQDYIFRYHEAEFEVIPFESRAWFGHVLQDHLLIRSAKNGVYVIRDGKPLMLPGTEFITRPLSGWMAMEQYDGENILIAGHLMGMYKYNLKGALAFLTNPDNRRKTEDSFISKFPTEIDEYLHKNGLSTMILHDGKYYISTIGGGVVVMDKPGRFLYVINKNRGLCSDIIYYLYKDASHNLWACSSSGMGRIVVDSPVSVFNDYAGVKQLPLSSIKYNEIRYLATLSDVLTLPKPKLMLKNHIHQFEVLVEKNMECFDFFAFEDLLFFNSDTHLVANYRDELVGKVEIIPRIRRFCYTPAFQSTLFLAHDPGFAYIKFRVDRSGRIPKVQFGKWNRIPKIDGWIDDLMYDSLGNFWLSSKYFGLIRVTFDGGDLNKVLIKRYTTKDGLPSMEYNRIYEMDKKLLVATSKGIYQAIAMGASDDNYQFVKADFLPPEVISDDIKVWQLGQDHQGRIWAATTAGFGCLVKGESGYTWDAHPLSKVKTRMIHFNIDLDNVLWLATSKGMYRFDPRIKKDYSRPFNTLLRRVKVGDDFYEFHGTFYREGSQKGTFFMIPSLDQSPMTYLRIPFHHNSVVFEYSAAYYEKPTGTKYSYILEGFDEVKSPWTRETKKEYSYLPAGEYTFRVKSKNVFGTTGTESVFSFAVNLPWYRTFLAYFGYVFSLMGLFYFLIKLNSKRLRMANLRLNRMVDDRTKELLLRNQEISEKNREITQQKEQILEQRDQLREINKRLEMLASQDGLTGISNHRSFSEFFKKEWARCLRAQEPIAVILVDVDFFKSYNDYYGHQEGDECLKRIAKTLTGLVHRPGDMVARYGGEEFIFVLSETDLAGVKGISEKARKSIFDLEIPHEVSTAAKVVTISLGGAVTTPTADTDPDSLVRRADELLYESKQSGRNNVTWGYLK